MNRKNQPLFHVVLILWLLGSPVYATADEFVEKMPIKPVHDEPTSPVTEVEVKNEGRTISFTTLTVPLGQSIALDAAKPFKRLSVANPNVADALILGPKQIYLTGKRHGYTTLSLWGNNNKLLAAVEIAVHVPIRELKRNLVTLFPKENNIVITTANEHIVLSGQVSSGSVKHSIGHLAEAYAPQKVLNFLKFLQQ